MPRLPEDPEPFFRLHLFVCVNERPADHPLGSCAGQGSSVLREYLKSKAKALGVRDVCVTASKCLSRCDKGPVMVIYPEGVWYQIETTADADEIFDVHLQKGGRVERLMLR